ncbi:hypothetical protein B0H13DRAFT_2367578 [Mycena leptocephala]|nr:hypothetical protein B0H13DRAFT_2367578 [Mycena leptocephala]
MAKDVFAIPQEFHFEILPSSMLPITKMQEFSVPLQSILNTATQPLQYFSQEAPDRIDQNSIHRLRHLPIPETKVIRKLVNGSHQAWLDGAKSIMYSHLSGGVATRFPLWGLTYWDEVADFKENVRGPLIKSLDWLAQQKRLSKKNPTLAALVEETSHILSMMPWG